MLRRTLATFLILASPALAAQPRASITGPARIGPGVQFSFNARGSVSDRPLRWKVEPAGLDLVSMTPDGTNLNTIGTVFGGATQGRYVVTIVARGIPDGEKELDADAATWIVEVGDGQPAPIPTPIPTPTPVPVPPVIDPTPVPLPAVAGRIHMTYVADAAHLTIDQAAMRRNATIESAFPGLDATFRWYLSDEPELARLGFGPLLSNMTLPRVVVQDSAGKVLAITPPGQITAEGLVNSVKAMRQGGSR